jgi:hypothetical protein
MSPRHPRRSAGSGAHGLAPYPVVDVVPVTSLTIRSLLLVYETLPVADTVCRLVLERKSGLCPGTRASGLAVHGTGEGART